MTLRPFVFDRTARSTGTALTVVVIWAILLAAWYWLEASPWIIAFLALFTLPALIDLIRNTHSGLRLNDEMINWYFGRHSGEVPLEEIDYVRLDTRLDFSVRATLVLHNRRKIRLPFECTPPHQAFEDALNTHGIQTKRFHFQLLQ